MSFLLWTISIQKQASSIPVRTAITDVILLTLTLLDIQEKNIMLGVEDNSILVDFEEGEKSHPSPRKIVGERMIYSSRKLGRTKNHGRPILCDFGQARYGSSTYSGDIQPYIYRAPEVVLRMPWDEKVDIWNLGVLVCSAPTSKLTSSRLKTMCLSLTTNTAYRRGTFSSKDIFFMREIPTNRIPTPITLLR
jgi:serine/threonine protein kinase